MRLPLDAQRLGRIFSLTGLILLGIAMIGPANADPPGNNATVKIDGIDFDVHSDNQPHPSCGFEVDFYGYEASVPYKVEFSVQPPTGDVVIYTTAGVLDADDATGGGSEAGLDGEVAVDLSDELTAFTPHPVQGFHVELAVTAPDGTPQGTDGKSKVFWVGPCGPPDPTTTTSTSTTSTSTTTTQPTTTSTSTTTTSTTTTQPTTTTTAPEVTTTAAPTTTTTPTTAVVPTTASGPTTSDTVLGTAGTRPQGVEVLGVQLARTGLDEVFLLAGLVLLALGLALSLSARSLEHRRAPGC